MVRESLWQFLASTLLVLKPALSFAQPPNLEVLRKYKMGRRNAAACHHFVMENTSRCNGQYRERL
jgi:hypothetical protein